MVERARSVAVVCMLAEKVEAAIGKTRRTRVLVKLGRVGRVLVAKMMALDGKMRRGPACTMLAVATMKPGFKEP